MRTITGMVVVSAFYCLAGCTPQPPPGPEPGFGGWAWNDFKDLNPQAGDGGVSASWGSWNKKLVFLILTDTDTSATTAINAAGPPTEYKVALELPKGRKDELRVKTPDGKTGSLVHGEQSYDLTQGPVFVLLPGGAGEKLQVLQLRRDLSGVPADVGSVARLLRDDQEIGRIFARVK
jgi:hypothetical protein